MVENSEHFVHSTIGSIINSIPNRTKIIIFIFFSHNNIELKYYCGGVGKGFLWRLGVMVEFFKVGMIGYILVNDIIKHKNNNLAMQN